MPWGEIRRARPLVTFPSGVVSNRISLVAPLVFLGVGAAGGMVLQAEGSALAAPYLASASESSTPWPLMLPTAVGLLVEQAPGDRGGENSRACPLPLARDDRCFCLLQLRGNVTPGL